MVSFQSPFSFSKDQRNLTVTPAFDESSSSSSTNKKRKRVVDDHRHHITEAAEGILNDHSIANSKSFSDLGLHLGSSLPYEWQRFLDIKSGQIHFYNTRTHMRTFEDPREIKVVEVEPASPRATTDHMSLELELNLPCGPRTSPLDSNKLTKNKHDSAAGTKPQFNNNSGTFFTKKDFVDKRDSPSLSLSSLSLPSSSEADHHGDEQQQQEEEMVATVCNRCHMLVMLCKTSPACPNCKFMHPPDHKPPNLFKPKHSTLLCFLK